MKILHLYHDIMNLYGEYANVSALERMLEKSGVKFTTDRLTLFDNADLGDYDFIYIGSGTEKNRKLVLQDFKKYKDFLVEYINSGKVILMTGNSFEMLGKTITDSTARFLTDSEFMILQLPSRTNAELQAILFIHPTFSQNLLSAL